MLVWEESTHRLELWTTHDWWGGASLHSWIGERDEVSPRAFAEFALCNRAFGNDAVLNASTSSEPSPKLQVLPMPQAFAEQRPSCLHRVSIDPEAEVQAVGFPVRFSADGQTSGGSLLLAFNADVADEFTIHPLGIGSDWRRH